MPAMPKTDGFVVGGDVYCQQTLFPPEVNNSLQSGMKADPESDLCIRLGGVHHERMFQRQKYHCMGVASYQL